MKPRCSVAIATWNRLDKLKNCLASVFQQSLADSIETLVIDNGSSDGTAAWLAQCGLPARAFAFGRNMGASAARNAGIRLSQADYVCFLDSDAVLLSADAIERCLDEVASKRHRAASCAIWLDAAKTRPFCFGGYIGAEWHFDGPRTRTQWENPDFLSTCFAVWDKKLLEELKGFNPWYFWGIEDLDISLRARQKGEQFKVLMDVHVHHDMAREGRPYQFDDFSKVFHSIERQRLYFALASKGLGEFFKALLRGPFRQDAFDYAWERKLSPRERLWAAGIYPLWRLAKLPWDYPTTRRDFLGSCPMPEPIQLR